MTNRELAESLGEKIRHERRITNEILQLIVVALDRRAYLELGYPSMFEWLVKGFEYSNAAAYRRIEAARLLKAVPEIGQKLETGKVSLSTVSKVQSVIKTQESAAGRRITADEKANVIAKIEGKDYREAAQTLFELYPAACRELAQDRRVVVDANSVRNSMTFSNETVADIQRAKEVLSHRLAGAKDSEVVAFAIKFLLDKLDPLRQKKRMTRAASESEAACVKTSSTAARKELVQNAGASCTFKHPQSGKICGSRYQIQIDHILPRALGGGDEPSNLRVRCREHNLFEAERIFGTSLMEKYRSS